MFCGKCGAKNADNAQFCANCGEKLTPIETPTVSAPETPSSSDSKNRKVGIIGVAAVAVIVLILLISLFSGRGYKATAKQYVDALLSGDGEEIVSLLPKKLVKTIIEENELTKEILITEIDEYLVEQLSYIGFFLGEDFEYKLKYQGSEPITDDWLDELKEDYKEDFNLRVSSARVVVFDVYIEMFGSEEPMDIQFKVIKIGGKWYIDYFSTSEDYLYYMY